MDTITKCVQIELGQRIGPCNDDKDDSAHYPFQIIRPIDFATGTGCCFIIQGEALVEN